MSAPHWVLLPAFYVTGSLIPEVNPVRLVLLFVPISQMRIQDLTNLINLHSSLLIPFRARSRADTRRARNETFTFGGPGASSPNFQAIQPFFLSGNFGFVPAGPFAISHGGRGWRSLAPEDCSPGQSID